MKIASVRQIALTAALALGCGGFSMPLAAQTDIETLLEIISRSDADPPPGVFALDPAPDSTRPSGQLVSILEDLRALGPGNRGRGPVPPPARRHVEDAIQHFEEALDLRQSGLGDFEAMNTAIADGIAALAEAKLPKGRPLQAKLAALQRQAAVVVRQVAADTIDAAARGENDDVVEQARAALEKGDLAIVSGEPLVAVALFQNGLNLAADVITFHADAFQQNIRDAMAGETIGWAYTIGQNGVFFDDDSDGLARTVADSPDLPQSPTKEMYIASMSKTISAVALLQLLDENGISVEDKVGPYLPASWNQGPGFEDVTFRHLLTHRSGIDAAGVSCCDAPGQTLASLQAIVAAGSTGASNDNPSVYTNANFSLMRILIPQLADGPAVIANFANIWPLEVVYAALYVSYVNQNVLNPADIDKVTCAPAEAANARTLLYSVNTPNGNGLDPDDWSLSCGATGWYLSSRELASFLAFLRFTNALLDPAVRDEMDELFLGWLDPVVFAGWIEGDFGVYRSHGGDYPGGSSPGMTGCMMNFQINVQVALLINSRGGSIGGHPCKVLRDAYDAAWF